MEAYEIAAVWKRNDELIGERNRARQFEETLKTAEIWKLNDQRNKSNG